MKPKAEENSSGPGPSRLLPVVATSRLTEMIRVAMSHSTEARVLRGGGQCYRGQERRETGLEPPGSVQENRQLEMLASAPY